MLEAFWSETKQVARGWRRTPAIIIVFVPTIGVALGAALLTASFYDAIVLRSVSANEPQRLVSISVTNTNSGQAAFIYSDTFDALRVTQKSFSKLSLYSTRLVRIEGVAIAADGVLEGIMHDYFDAFGAHSSFGRFFTDNETEASAVVSDRFLRRISTDASAVVGRTLNLDGFRVTVIGAASAGMHGLQFDGGSDVFVSLPTFQLITRDRSKSMRGRNVIGLLRPDVTLAQARAEVLTLWPQLQASTIPLWLPESERETFKHYQVSVDGIAKGFSTLRLRFERPLAVLLGLSATLLAIACANLAGLMLARTIASRNEFSVLFALGAPKRRIVARILFENVALTALGLFASLPAVWAVVSIIEPMLAYGRSTPLIQTLTPSSATTSLALLVAIGVGLMIGLAQAWCAVRVGQNPANVQQRVVNSSLGLSSKSLLTAQVALSMVALVGAFLFGRTLSELRTGLDGIYAYELAFTRLARIPGDRRPLTTGYWQALVRDLEGIRGAKSVALSVNFPAYFEFPDSAPTDSYVASQLDAGFAVSAITELTSPMFFQTTGISLVDGRDFAWSDQDGTPAVAILNVAAAQSLFPNGEAIGNTVAVGRGKEARQLLVIGISRNAPIGSLREQDRAVVFRPILQDVTRAQFPMAHVRYDGDLRAVREDFVRAVNLQGFHFVRAVFTLGDWADSALMKERMIFALSAFIAVLVVALACIGVYSMLAYSVSTRVREIGVRLAIGATGQEIARMVLRDGLLVGVPGIVIGLVLALATVQLVRAQVYGVELADPMVLVFAVVTFIVTLLVASLLPAIRASKTDPVQLLRQD